MTYPPMHEPMAPAQIMEHLVRKIDAILARQDRILERIDDLETTGQHISAQDFQAVAERLAISEGLVLAMRSRAKKEIPAARESGVVDGRRQIIDQVIACLVNAACVVIGAGATIIVDRVI